MTLRGLQSAANHQGQSSPLTWRALNTIGQNYGLPAIDYDRFAIRWETDPELQNVVDRFDQNGIVLKTDKMEPTEVPGNVDQGESEVSKMAKHALKKG